MAAEPRARERKTRRNCVNRRSSVRNISSTETLLKSSHSLTTRDVSAVVKCHYGYATHPETLSMIDGMSTLLTLFNVDAASIRYTLENYRDKIRALIAKLRRYDLAVKEHDDGPEAALIDPIEEFYAPENAHKRVKPAAPDPESLLLTNDTGIEVSGPSLSRCGTAPKSTCVVKMRVKIEYTCHDHALDLVSSSNQDPRKRQMEEFVQSIEILRSRETGCALCEIHFTDIMYLNAFWRDYLDGSLRVALKHVFLSEVMKTVSRDENLDLHVSVDEEDFMRGKLLLMDNLKRNLVSGSSVNKLSGTVRVEQSLVID